MHICDEPEEPNKTVLARNITQFAPTTDEELEILDATTDDIFRFKPWTLDQIQTGNIVRDALKVAFSTIVANVPPSADRSAALRKLRECRMDCNSAITHGGKY